MDYNKDKVDECTLALLYTEHHEVFEKACGFCAWIHSSRPKNLPLAVYLVMWDETFGSRAWKGFDWDTMNRLHEKGYISDPKNKAKSVAVTEEGSKQAKERFRNIFVDSKG